MVRIDSLRQNESFLTEEDFQDALRRAELVIYPSSGNGVGMKPAVESDGLEKQWKEETQQFLRRTGSLHDDALLKELRMSNDAKAKNDYFAVLQDKSVELLYFRTLNIRKMKRRRLCLTDLLIMLKIIFEFDLGHFRRLEDCFDHVKKLYRVLEELTQNPKMKIDDFDVRAKELLYKINRYFARLGAQGENLPPADIVRTTRKASQNVLEEEIDGGETKTV